MSSSNCSMIRVTMAATRAWRVGKWYRTPPLDSPASAAAASSVRWPTPSRSTTCSAASRIRRFVEPLSRGAGDRPRRGGADVRVVVPIPRLSRPAGTVSGPPVSGPAAPHVPLPADGAHVGFELHAVLDERLEGIAVGLAGRPVRGLRGPVGPPVLAGAAPGPWVALPADLLLPPPGLGHVATRCRPAAAS